MGDCNNGELLPSYNFGAAPFDDRRFSKHIHDNVHGNIYLDRQSLKFIDTEQFQRLHDLKQLGLTYMVYPGAVHSRFEHSLGVYWLASDAVHRLKTYQGLELGIESFDVQTVKLAGLLHDVGHGPFSHMFEREFLPRVCDGIKWSHEDMSLKMIDYIVDEHNIDIDSDTLKKAKKIMNQLSAMGIKFDEEIQGLLLLGSLPDSWEIFRNSLSNSAPDGVIFMDFAKSSVLNEEIRRKFQGSSSDVPVTGSRGRNKNRGSQNREHSRSKSRGRLRDIECYHCGMKGHTKRFCWKLKRENKEKEENKDDTENCLATISTEDLVTVLDADLINIVCDESCDIKE